MGIELKAEDLYGKEKVSLETNVIEDVFKLLQCDDQGLTSEDAVSTSSIPTNSSRYVMAFPVFPYTCFNALLYSS